MNRDDPAYLERREKRVMIDWKYAAALLDAFDPEARALDVPYFPDLPAGYRVGDVWLRVENRALAIRVYHESFDPVPDGMESPEIYARWELARVPALPYHAPRMHPAFAPGGAGAGLFHRLWSKAVDAPGYDKAEWKALEALLCGPSRPEPEPEPVVLLESAVDLSPWLGPPRRDPGADIAEGIGRILGMTSGFVGDPYPTMWEILAAGPIEPTPEGSTPAPPESPSPPADPAPIRFREFL